MCHLYFVLHTITRFLRYRFNNYYDIICILSPNESSLLPLGASSTATGTVLPGLSYFACYRNDHPNTCDLANIWTFPFRGGSSITYANTGLLALRSSNRHQLPSDPFVAESALAYSLSSH